MKVLVQGILCAVALVAPAVKTVWPANVGDFPAKCAAFYATRFGVPVELVDAVIEVESAWNPYAVSSKGAAGLMQLMPATALRFGVRNRFDIEDNIRGGVAYLAWLLRLFHGDLRLVVGAYNAGQSPILLRGLRYSSPEVLIYVTRVARVYRTLRLRARRNPAMWSVAKAAGGER